MKPERASTTANEAARSHQPSYYKAGTIERLMKWRGTHDGKRLPAMSKAIAVTLLSYARTNKGFTCVVSEPELCDDLGIDPKTLRKYLKPLLEFGLVETDRSREGAAKRYDCSKIYERFGEERDITSKVSSLDQRGITSRSAQSGIPSLSADSDREDTAVTRESIPVSPGRSQASDRDAFPVSIKETPSSSSSSSLLDVDAPAARLGITNTHGFERQVFTIDEVLTRWGWAAREQRSVVKRFGLIRVSGAIGYVLQQQKLHPDTIREPAGLFRYALKHDYSSELPEAQTGKASRSDTDAVEERQTGTPSLSAAPGPVLLPSASGIAEAILAHLQERLPTHVFQAMFKNVSLECAEGAVTLRCDNDFAADMIRSRYQANLSEAASAILGVPAAQIHIIGTK